MRSLKKLGVLVIAVLALGAFGAANASAEFTASALGEIHGNALETQVFETVAGTIECAGATTTGSITALASTEQHVTVHYSNCKAFGLVNVHISTATYLFTTHEGTVHVVEPITITVTKTLFTAHCTVTVGKQTLSKVDFINNGNNVIVQPTIGGIHSVGSGGVCGGTNSTGTYTGKSEVSRVGGGTVSVDH
jgi:hypothetical protein